MIINEKDSERLERFTDATLEFIKRESKATNLIEAGYKINKKGFVKSIPEAGGNRSYLDRHIFDIDFRSFILLNLSKLFDEMNKSIDSKLFGFAERSLYELITTWTFLSIHPDVKTKHLRRISGLLLACMFKTVDEDELSYDTQIRTSKPYLTSSDILKLETSQNAGELFDYLWDVLVGVVSYYGHTKTHSFLDTVKYDAILSHQHMRIHANPLSILEALGEIDRNSRHRLLLAYLLRQVVEYFNHVDPENYKKLSYSYEKFRKNNSISL